MSYITYGVYAGDVTRSREVTVSELVKIVNPSWWGGVKVKMGMIAQDPGPAISPAGATNDLGVIMITSL
jgi:hypothetical protein